MLSREWRLRVEDILEAISRIQQYTAALTSETFAANNLVVDAVVRNFTVIGEAARAIPPDIETRYAGIAWAKMRGMRNVVVHGYFAVDSDILWVTLQHDLPPLVPQLNAILEQER